MRARLLFAVRCTAVCFGVSGWFGASAAVAIAEDGATDQAPAIEEPVVAALEPVQEAPAPTPGAPVATPVRAATPADSVRAQLHGTRWTISLMPIGAAAKGKPSTDTVMFEGRTVTSEALSKAGYSVSNYTLTVDEGGNASWETMQTKPDQGVVFWKGEFQGSTMQGVMSRHPVGKNTEDFTFSGQEESGRQVVAPKAGEPIIIPTAAPAAPTAMTPSAPTTLAPAASQPAPASGKKKRGWLGR